MVAKVDPNIVVLPKKHLLLLLTIIAYMQAKSKHTTILPKSRGVSHRKESEEGRSMGQPLQNLPSTVT
jgi:hypothetical protein